MFEITRDDIAALNDEDLRTLIGRLCEAELRRNGLPVSAATWGGDQTAKDGGLDVRLRWRRTQKSRALSREPPPVFRSRSRTCLPRKS
jgi:hypothetical protein